MLAKVFSCALIGLEGAVVEVEANLNSRSLPSVTLVGLPDAAVKESTERVRAAIFNSGLTYPRGRLTVNLAPADLRKEGSAIPSCQRQNGSAVGPNAASRSARQAAASVQRVTPLPSGRWTRSAISAGSTGQAMSSIWPDRVIPPSASNPAASVAPASNR